MNGRGRPRTPDILTPREWEVLDLVREGLSNREIAERLQISLAGAKFHVSEIISKLGVSTREEAAVWRPERRWGFAPLGALAGFQRGATSLLATKLVAVAVIAALAAGGVGLAFLVSRASDNSGTVVTSTAADLCTGCYLIEEVPYATIEEAAANASFVPMFPASLPSGFERYRILASERDFSNPYVPEVHNDWITVVYRDQEGHRLVISQGFPALVNARYTLPGSGGTLQVNGREALWSANVPLSIPAARVTDFGLVLTLYLGKFGSGWGEEGSLFSGSPMEYSIGSDSLSLDELIALADSVTFPDILQPSNGVTPEPFFK